MPITVHRTERGLSVELEESLTIRNAQDVATELSVALRGGDSVTVGTTRLQDVDTSILQLLCSLRKSAPVLSFESPSEAFITAVDRCGLRRELLGRVKEGI